MTYLPGILRIFLGLWLLIGAVWFGANGSNPWIVFALAGVFTVAFGIGRWRAWLNSWQAGKMLRALVGQLGTYSVQAVLCGLLFLVGWGVSSFAGGTAAVNLEVNDLPRLSVWGGVAIGLGLVLIVLESRSGAVSGLPPTTMDATAGQGKTAEPAYAVQIPTLPITEDDFYQGPHYRHISIVGTQGTPGYRQEVIAEKAFLSEAQVAEQEERLGIALPPLLRRLYLRQNGGSCISAAARTELEHHNVIDGWIDVFGGYDDLTPLTDLRTLEQSIKDYADPDLQPDAFPEGCSRMIILAQFYRETLFLDYRHAPSDPRIGFCDFDRAGVDDLRDLAWEDSAEWWSDFDTFFASLRRRPEDVLEDV